MWVCFLERTITEYKRKERDEDWGLGYFKNKSTTTAICRYDVKVDGRDKQAQKQSDR